jgi:hypothetical protein
MDSTRTEAETVAGIIESGAAWWTLAARALAEGDHEQAAKYAHLLDIGTKSMRDRIAAIDG